MLQQSARRFPDRPALIWRDQSWTWAAFCARVQSAAGALAAHGVQHGDRVLVHARNSNAVLESMFATWMLGAVWVPTNFRLTPPEVAYLAASSGAAVHIFDAAFADHAAAAKAENPGCRLEISIGPGLLEWQALAAHGPAMTRAAEVAHDHPAWFFYTSGTTGRPKAGVLTHGQMEYVVCNHLCDLMPGTTEQDVSLVVAPLSHGAGVHALPQVARVQALGKLGNVLVQYFGMGEVTGNITVLPRELHSLDDAAMPVGSCGFPRTGMAVAILDLDGNELLAGITGEICVRGPGVFAGYHDNPEATAQATRFGWFHTGDLGHMDAQGFVYITGRASDMYISGGSNVYPREIEEALLMHPAIAEACVVGMPDARWGESGVAVLVAAAGAEIDTTALLAHLEGRLAKYKWPARFVVWPELPKSGYGKVTKREVKLRLEETA